MNVIMDMIGFWVTWASALFGGCYVGYIIGWSSRNAQGDQRVFREMMKRCDRLWYLCNRNQEDEP